MKKESVGDKISKILEEKKYGVNSREYIVLKIYNLTKKEYEQFINFVKNNTPHNKGYEAINILLQTYKNYQKIKSLDKYVKELEEKVKKNE